MQIAKGILLSRSQFQRLLFHVHPDALGNKSNLMKREVLALILLDTRVWRSKVQCIPSVMTEPHTGFVDGIIFMSTDASKQLQLPQVAGGSKVTVVGATSRGVDAQGTSRSGKDAAADGYYITHPQDSKCFSGNSGGAYTITTSTGLQTLAVHCGVARSATESCALATNTYSMMRRTIFHNK